MILFSALLLLPSCFCTAVLSAAPAALLDHSEIYILQDSKHFEALQHCLAIFYANSASHNMCRHSGITKSFCCRTFQYLDRSPSLPPQSRGLGIELEQHTCTEGRATTTTKNNFRNHLVPKVLLPQFNLGRAFNFLPALMLVVLCCESASDGAVVLPQARHMQ